VTSDLGVARYLTIDVVLGAERCVR